MSTTHLHDADRTTGTCDCMAFLDIHYVAKTCNIIDSIDPCNLFHQLLVILQIKINRSNVGQRDFMQTKKQKKVCCAYIYNSPGPKRCGFFK